MWVFFWTTGSYAEKISERIADRSLLNLFAYTGAFSVHARVGGADRTTTVDLSKTYLEWYQRNCELNALAEDDRHIWIQDDCLQFLEDGPQPGEPTTRLSWTPDVFKFQAHEGHLLGWKRSCLLDRVRPGRFMATGGELFFSTNDRGFELDEERLPGQLEWKEISNRTVPEDFQGNRKVHRAWRFREAENARIKLTFAAVEPLLRCPATQDQLVKGQHQV